GGERPPPGRGGGGGGRGPGEGCPRRAPRGMVSLPTPPLIVSAPAPPSRTSAPAPPVMVSAPPRLVPTTVMRLLPVRPDASIVTPLVIATPALICRSFWVPSPLASAVETWLSDTGRLKPEALWLRPVASIFLMW